MIYFWKFTFYKCHTDNSVECVRAAVSILKARDVFCRIEAKIFIIAVLKPAIDQYSMVGKIVLP